MFVQTPETFQCRRFFLFQLIIIFTAVEYKGIVYHGYKYPWWGEGIGWSFVVTAIGMIPLWAFIQTWKQVGGSCWVSICIN